MKKLSLISPFIGITVILSLSSQYAFAVFPDVYTGNTNYDAIKYVKDKGIVSGYPDGTFKPANKINRAEFTKIIINSQFSASEIDSCLGGNYIFPDVSKSQWFAKYVCVAKKEGIISGYPDGTFKPESNINFAEAAKIIVNAFGYPVDSDAVWYKPYVEKLGEESAIPATIKNFTYNISRGEMAEIIYRLDNKITASPSLTYNDLSVDDAPVTEGAAIGSCPVFPADSPWNTDISDFPVHSDSDAFINSIGADDYLHPDFGGDGEYGIPFITVDEDQPKIPINFTDYGDESDPGPYPVPLNAPIEGGASSDGDRHVLVVDTNECKLYELYYAFPQSSSWNASNGAVYDLNSNELRPDYWTSADAAGLPIFAGLVRYDEVAQGEVKHALRFTVSSTQKGFIHPATHYASSKTNSNLPPMGLRLRLKKSYNISSFTGQARVILEGLKKYGMIVADNGSDWFVTGAADKRWNDEDLGQLKEVPGNAFEAVYTGEIIY